MNLLYLNTHDTGRMISPYGYNIPTDNLLNFASDATTFTHAFCVSPTCSPSRAGMLTGTYPHQNGMLGLAQRGFGLIKPEQHLANILKKYKYNTCISGIQHEFGWYLDLDVEGLKGMGYDNILTVSSKEYDKEDLHLWDRENAIKAVEWIENYNDTKPFMLSYGMHSTHRPYPINVLESIDKRYVKPAFPAINNEGNRHDQAQYMTTAYYADNNIGLILDALKKKGLYEDTLIVFTTDHGLALPFNKCNLTDSGIGVSLIIRVPGKKQGQIYDGIISQIDLVPTICDILSLNKPEYLEGKSFYKVFNDINTKINEYIFAEVNFHTSYEPIRCIRTERYKYIRYYDKTWNKINVSNMDESVPKSFILDNGLREKVKYSERLFDLYYDSNEQNNLINDNSYSEVKEGLIKVLDDHLNKTNDPIIKGELEIKPNYKVNKKECITASSKNPLDYDSRGRTS